ncbi:hypothetical protein EJJ20_14685 [Pseudomonas poae]|nr:hypothetical protein EJJ20_14685 [Pseudomonas poae]
MNPAQNQCGSGLARECGESVGISMTDTPPSRASPLPHLNLHQAQNLSAGSGLGSPYTAPTSPPRWRPASWRTDQTAIPAR